MTTTTRRPRVIIPPESLILLLNGMDTVLFAAYCRLKYRCSQFVTGIYETSLEELACMEVDNRILCQLLAQGLIRWEFNDIHIISIV